MINRVIIVGHLGQNPEIRTRSYEKDGQKKYITEIIADEFRLLGHAPKPTES